MATTAKHKKDKTKKKKVAFVTVGTTRFDALVQVMSTPTALATLATHGFTHLVLQIGASLEPALAVAGGAEEKEEEEEEEEEERIGGGSPSPSRLRRRTGRGQQAKSKEEGEGEKGGGEKAAVAVAWYRYKDSLRPDMEAADLIISHAGAGSVMEALDLGKTLLVVVNTALMDDHQQELARAMEEQGFLVATGPPHVLDSLRTYDAWHDRLTPRPSPTLGLLPALLDQEMGFASSLVQLQEGEQRRNGRGGGRLRRGGGAAGRA